MDWVGGGLPGTPIRITLMTTNRCANWRPVHKPDCICICDGQGQEATDSLKQYNPSFAYPDLDLGSTSGQDSLRLQKASGAGVGWCTGEFRCRKEPVRGGTKHSRFLDCLLEPGWGEPGICCDWVSCRWRPTMPLVGLVPTTVPGAGRTLGNPEDNEIKLGDYVLSFRPNLTNVPCCVCDDAPGLSVGVIWGPVTDAWCCSVFCCERSCESWRDNEKRLGLNPRPATPLVTYWCNELKKLIFTHTYFAVGRKWSVLRWMMHQASIWQ